MKILLATLHAKYSHASLALPCLASYCRDIKDISFVIREWTVHEPREHLLRLIMAEQADLVAFSCYIWNIEKILLIASDLKKIAPDVLIALGGPEASFGVFELMHHNPAVDFVVKGEGEAVFCGLVETLANHGASPRLEGSLQQLDNLFFRDGSDIVTGPLSREHLPLDTLASPFEAGLIDLDKPLVYYETSRGCPFSCAFCLSAMEGQVRTFSMARITSDLQFLMRRHVPQVKLVDRTFNYDARRASQIWEFILEQNQGSHFHFEIAADLLTEENLHLLKRVPPNTFHFEIGIQSTSEETLQRVGRKADLARSYENIRRLRSETGIELHLDLVAGLPGENYQGFLDSLDLVANLQPHMIQIEPLKVLKGSPMREIARQEEYQFSSSPPYTILRTPWLSFEDICRIETVGRLLDLFYNNGGFAATLKLLQQKMTFAGLFDHLARMAGAENLSSLSTRRVYELFARLSTGLTEEADGCLIHDALFFDYCRTEMPLLGKLPTFADRLSDNCAWPGRRELPADLKLPDNCRIKLFRCTFGKDYRDESRGAGPATMTFVYVSGTGQGLRVLVV